MIKGAVKLPIRHITIRVPYHDNNYDGTVCKTPKCNTSCMVLKRIGQEKDQHKEELVASKRIGDLKESERPPCQAERVSFMDPNDWVRVANHAYAKSAETHKHYIETPFTHLGYSAACNPYYWMMNENAEELAQKMSIGFNPEREPELNFNTIWIQERTNQLVMLDTFFGALKPDESLCFFYAKKTPLSENNKRVIVGIGRVKRIDEPVEYRYDVDVEKNSAKLRSTMWERNVVHSIRPGFKDGFLFPYQEILEKAQKDSSINPEDYVAFAPDEEFSQYSYASEHLDSNGAITSLISAAQALHKISEIIEGPWKQVISWIDDEINRLWKLRGAYPGLGSALSAFGISNGTFVALKIENEILKEDDYLKIDPWDIFITALSNPSILDNSISKQVKDRWNALKEHDVSLLKLISRFSLSTDQARRIFQKENQFENVKTIDLLRNPYLIYETDRNLEDSISIHQIEMGMFPSELILKNYSIPEISRMEDNLDKRRIKSLVVYQLAKLANEGHSHYFKKLIINKIKEADLVTSCPVGPGSIDLAEEDFGKDIQIIRQDEDNDCYQLAIYSTCRELIRDVVEGRSGGSRHKSKCDWRVMLDKSLGSFKKNYSQEEIDREEKARVEKSSALRELFESRFGNLIGPAGTGKTTLLSIFCNELKSNRETFLLLAPTGKARVRLSSATGITNAQTIAQFLSVYNRYDGKTGRYLINNSSVRPEGYDNIIIDECSMLTEEQLASIFDCFSGVKLNRIILVGDPRQLPPIGAGRPFFDILKHLTKNKNLDNVFPRVLNSYAELTVVRRQDGLNRADVLLSQYFSGDKISSASEDIALKAPAMESDYLKLVKYVDTDDLEGKILECLAKELKLHGIDDEVGFEESIGGRAIGNDNRVYFNNGYKDWKGAGSFAENWQILSPVKPGGSGVEFINRLIQDRFRKRVWEWVNVDKFYNKKILDPMGPQRILYGDKVINVKNAFKNDIWPEVSKEESYIANGDIGVVVGQYKSPKMTKMPWKIEVEFSTKLGHKVGFPKSQFGEDSTNPLELAYALTIHKSQGSQFGITFIVLPNPCWLLSRELLYTALTRHENKIIILYQGEWNNFLQLSRDDQSSMTTRFTNIFSPSKPVKVEVKGGEKYFEKTLIHLTEKGELVRSKSEVIVANLLYSNGLGKYNYEVRLTCQDGTSKLPDFTIENMNSGKIVYWEHLGMLERTTYKNSWLKKEKWYQQNDINYVESGGGKNGGLITTIDEDNGSIDSHDILKKIEMVKKFLK